MEFTAAVYSGREGEDVSVTVSLRGSSERRVEVGFTSRVGTADGEGGREGVRESIMQEGWFFAPGNFVVLSACQVLILDSHWKELYRSSVGY